MTHVVLARTRNEYGLTGYVRVTDTESDDWSLVQRRWSILDAGLRAGRLYAVKPDPKWLYVLPVPGIAYLMVRETTDPVVRQAHETISLVVADNREAKHVGSLQRRWGNAHGYHGHIGGWLYRNPCHRDEVSVTQGWSNLVPAKAIARVLLAGRGYVMPVQMP